jgi:c-di-GMP-binding flagellar brake protein YcgR
MFTVAVTLDFNGSFVRGSECRDISLGGMLVALREVVELNKKGVVTLTTKCGPELITFRAFFQVVRECAIGESNRETGIGIIFTGMDNASVHNLNRIITYCQ